MLRIYGYIWFVIVISLGFTNTLLECLRIHYLAWISILHVCKQISSNHYLVFGELLFKDLTFDIKSLVFYP